LGQDVTKEEEKIRDIQLRLSRLDANSAENDPEKIRLDKLKAAYKELGNEIKNLFGSIVNGIFERQKNQIQDQIDLIEQRKQREIEAVNAETISNQEKADKIKLIEARAEANRQQLEIKKRQTQQRQAQFERAIRIGEIIANTAKAVTAALPNVPLSVIAGAIGAAQIATVLATPIPRYKHGIYGSNSHPGGLALTNDGGKREVIAEPGKAPYLQYGMNVLSELPKGTQVYPDVEVFNRMNAMQLHNHLITASKPDPGVSDQLLEKQIKATRELGRIISSKKETHFHWSNGELKKSVSKGTAWTNYLNSNVFD
jgi:hypothetical protein